MYCVVVNLEWLNIYVHTCGGIHNYTVYLKKDEGGGGEKRELLGLQQFVDRLSSFHGNDRLS